MRNVPPLIVIIVIWLTLPLAQARNSMEKEQSAFSAGAVIGLPDFIGLQLNWIGIPNLEIGVGFGSIPINNVLNAHIKMSPQPVNLGTPDTYNLYPSATYSLSAANFIIRYFPSDTGLFFHLSTNGWFMGANLVGNLKDENTQAVYQNAVTGNITLSQPLVSALIGYQFFASNRLYFEFAGGASFLLPAHATITSGGTASAILAVSPAGEQSFQDAKANLQSQIDQAIKDYQSAIKILPSLIFSFGFVL